jgi:MFS family permease
MFFFAGTAYGVPGAFTAVLMPYLARRANLDLAHIGWYVTLLFVPTWFQFVYAPVVDFWLRRKHWLVLLALVGGASLFVACQMTLPDQVVPFLGFAFIAQVFSGLIGSCNGGLMAAGLTDAQRGKAGGWYNAGNLSGGGISAWIAAMMTSDGYPAWQFGGVLALMMVGPALVMLFVHEPLRKMEGTLIDAIARLLGEVKAFLWTKAGITGILLCLSPVGTAALANYFSGVAQDYVTHDLAGELAKLPPDVAAKLVDSHVAHMIGIVSGLGGQIITAVGSIAGGFICDRTNRRAMYLLSGVLTAIVGLAMALSPTSESTFIYGGLTYALVTGFCYAAFTATVLETIGKDTKSASTRYSMFTAAGNVAIAYVGLIDSRFMKHHGVDGVVGSDAVLNIAGVVVLGLVFWKLGSFGKTRHVPDPELPVAKVVDKRE